jgi:hypothetical protein
MQSSAAAACLDDVTGQPVLLTTRIDLAESLSINGTTANQTSTAVFAPQAIAQTFARTSCSVGSRYQNVAGAIFHFDPNRVAGGGRQLPSRHPRRQLAPSQDSAHLRLLLAKVVVPLAAAPSSRPPPRSRPRSTHADERDPEPGPSLILLSGHQADTRRSRASVRGRRGRLRLDHDVSCPGVGRVGWSPRLRSGRWPRSITPNAANEETADVADAELAEAVAAEAWATPNAADAPRPPGSIAVSGEGCLV